MAIELVTSLQTCDQQIEIVNDNFIELEGSINELNPDGIGWVFQAGPPDSADGFDGDMYFDTTNAIFYGPKVAGAWPAEGIEAGGGSDVIWLPVRVATTANITLSGAQTIDDISVVAGNRVLVKYQDAGEENGIYVAASGAWTRATDANATLDFAPGKLVYVQDGTINIGSLWAQYTTEAITVGTTAIGFSQVGGYASETGLGLSRAATQSEVDAGSSSGAYAFVTSETLAAWTGGAGEAAASETVAGIAELATQTETNTGTDDARIVTPLKLASRTSTDTRAGVVELATDAETQTGTDTSRAITPANLSARSATETRSGIAELATQAETDTGTDDNRIITPLKAATRFLAKAGGTLTGFLTLHADPTSALHAVTKQYADALVAGGASPASETVAGIAELATQTETDTGTDDARIVTPLKAATRFLAKVGGTLTGFLTLHADPTSAMHAATKQYVDAAGGGFSVTDPEYFDDFVSGSTTVGSIGVLGWGSSGGSAISGQAGEQHHPGIVRRDTGASSGTVAYIQLAAVTTTIAPENPADTFDITWLFRLNTNDANTTIRAGLGTGSSNPPADGLYAEKLAADTQWFGVTRASSSQTRTAALASTSTSWVKLRVRRIDASTIGFSIDGGTEATLTATIPTAAMMPFLHIVNTAAASKTVDIDYFYMKLTGLSR